MSAAEDASPAAADSSPGRDKDLDETSGVADSSSDLNRYGDSSVPDAPGDSNNRPLDQGDAFIATDGPQPPQDLGPGGNCAASWSAWSPSTPCPGYACCEACTSGTVTCLIRCNSSGLCSCYNGVNTKICSGTSTCETSWENMCCQQLWQ